MTQRYSYLFVVLPFWLVVSGLFFVGGLPFGFRAPVVGVVEAAQQPAEDGGFTADQVSAGFTVYARECGECHGVNLDGVEAPPLRGADFLNGWAGQTTDELITYVEEAMPPGLGGSLSAEVYLNIVAYILAENGARPGDVALTSDATVMIGDAADAIRKSERLLEMGVMVIGFAYPVVPKREARLRVQVSAALEEGHLEKVLDAFAKL